MNATDKAKNAAQDARGKVKEGFGRLTGNDRLRAEGKSDQAAAHVKHAAEKAKETVQHGAEAARGKVKEGAGKVAGDDELTAEGQADQDAARLRENLNK
jgi:uncharacterized protein YjbJ (UPF0337 family)